MTTSQILLDNAIDVPMLRVDDLNVRFGGAHILKDVSLDLRAGEILAVIGPNGAGKTTLFNCITGSVRPESGSAQLGDRNLLGLRPSHIAGLGVARTFQNLALIGVMSVRENLLLGRHLTMRNGFTNSVLRPVLARREEESAARAVAQLATDFALEEVLDRPVRELPQGICRRVELARALAMRPSVLLLDEPAAGLNPTESAAFAEYIRRARSESGLAVIVIEHDLSFVFSLADRVTVLDFGTVIASGPPDRIRKDPQVIEAYLGKGGDQE